MSEKSRKSKYYSYVKTYKRCIRPACRGNCKKLKGTKCFLLDEDDRQKIFDEFWSKYDSKKPRERHKFLNTLIDILPLKSGQPAYEYHLSLNGERIRVCREMFLSTFGISSKMLKITKEYYKVSEAFQENVTKTNLDRDDEKSVLNEDCTMLKCEDRVARNVFEIKNYLIKKEIGVQCNLLQEQWFDFSANFKPDTSDFEVFLQKISLKSPISLQISKENFIKSKHFSDSSLTSALEVDMESSSSGSANEKQSVIASHANSLEYQDDIDTFFDTFNESDTYSNFYHVRDKMKLDFANTMSGYKCSECGKIFRKRSSILAHIQKHFVSLSDSVQCKEKFSSDRTLSSNLSLSKQYLGSKKLSSIKKIESTKVFKRKIKKKSAGSEQNAETKLTTTLKTCPICPEKFVNQQLFIDHMNKHTKEKLYKCSCGNKFIKYSDLSVHLSKSGCISNSQRKLNIDSTGQTWSNRETFYCKICDIDFDAKRSEKHFRSEIHLQKEYVWIRKYNIRKFLCLECDSQFEILIDLIQHRVGIHHKRISFLFFERLENFNLKYCYVCNKSFVKFVSFYDHMNMHKKIYAYACSCGKKFQFYNSLIYHADKRGCPTEGRILPSYCPKLNNVKSKTSTETINKQFLPVEPKKFCEKVIKNVSDETICHEDENDVIKVSHDPALNVFQAAKSAQISKKSLTVQTDLPNSEFNLLSQQNGIITNQTNILNSSPDFLLHPQYYQQVYNNGCSLEQNQIVTIPPNSSSHQFIQTATPAQFISGAVYIYETMPHPTNIIQIPQIVSLNQLGQNVQMAINTNASKHSVIQEISKSSYHDNQKDKNIQHCHITKRLQSPQTVNTLNDASHTDVNEHTSSKQIGKLNSLQQVISGAKRSALTDEHLRNLHSDQNVDEALLQQITNSPTDNEEITNDS